MIDAVIHSRLYHGGLPKKMQDNFTICAFYTTMTKKSKVARFHIMEAKVAEIIGESNDMNWCIADDTVRVQAFILVHTT